MYTLQGNLIHTTHTFFALVHIRHMYASYGHSPYVATFRKVINRVERIHYPWEKGSHPNPQHTGWSIRESVSSFSPTTTIEAVGKSQASIGNKLHWFVWLIYPECDQYVQYLLTGANPSFLNQHRRGLQPWRYRLSTSHYPAFQTDGPLLSPNDHVRS
jgi:hypothetical protein